MPQVSISAGAMARSKCGGAPECVLGSPPELIVHARIKLSYVRYGRAYFDLAFSLELSFGEAKESGQIRNR